MSNNWKARAMNAERMVEKLKTERTIIHGWSVLKNFVIAGLVLTVILLVV